MAFRDDRRRRLLNEEILGAAARDEAGDDEASPESPGPSPARRRARYAKAADMSNQPRVTELVPQRKLTIFALVLLALGVIAGLEALYWWMPRLAKAAQAAVVETDAGQAGPRPEAGGDAPPPQRAKHPHKPPRPKDGRIAAFDLDGEGSLAAGFSAALLALAGVTALLVYSLRRHRLDDYGGRYRIWLWAALCWFMMSMDEACTLHEGFKEMMVYLTGQRLYGDGSLWWVIAYGAALSLTGLLVLWDMRRCWFASLAFLATAALFATAVAAQLGFVLPDGGAREVMVEEGCEMLGHLCLLLSMVVYARHVIREIDGRGGKKKAKRKGVKSADAGSTKSAAKPATETAAAESAAAATPTAGSQIRKDPRHVTPGGPTGKPLLPAANKAKADRRGR